MNKEMKIYIWALLWEGYPHKAEMYRNVKGKLPQGYLLADIWTHKQEVAAEVCLLWDNRD